MLTVNFIRENKKLAIEQLAVRNFPADKILDRIISLDDKRKEIQNLMDNCLAEINSLSKEIGRFFKEGKQEEALIAKEKSTEKKEESKSLNQKLSDVEKELKELLIQVPNVPHKSVPKGKEEKDNQIIKSLGLLPDLGKETLAHWELAKKYDIIDFDAGNILTGSGFPVYKGKGARLQRALISFFLDEAIKSGYTEVIPPLMVNEDSAFATGQLPDKDDQMYYIGSDNFYLIPTAEVPVTNLFRDKIIKSENFPIKMTAYTPCFRREAGSYGKDVRGLNRVHQFDKVEIVQIQHPDRSYETLDEMVNYVTKLIQKLEIPFRIVRLCGGDLGFAASLTFDFEVYAAAQKKWLEVSSVSNFESYQAARLKLRFKEGDNKKSRFAHTLNGSALALPRIVAALLENNQSEKGISLPKVISDYAGFNVIN